MDMKLAKNSAEAMRALNERCFIGWQSPQIIISVLTYFIFKWTKNVREGLMERGAWWLVKNTMGTELQPKTSEGGACVKLVLQGKGALQWRKL